MWNMNPTPIPPARGASIPRHLAGSPPGRGEGWVVGGGVDFSFQTCSPELEFRQTQGGLHTWCRRVAGSVACSAGIKPAELLFDLSAGKPAAPWDAPSDFRMPFDHEPTPNPSQEGN